MPNKKGVMIFFDEWSVTCEELTDAECGKVIKAIVNYAQTGEERKLTGKSRMAYGMLKIMVDQNTRKYNAICEKRKAASMKGNEARWGKSSQKSQESQMAILGQQNNIPNIPIPNSKLQTVKPNSKQLNQTPIPNAYTDDTDNVTPFTPDNTRGIAVYISETLGIPITGKLADDLRDFEHVGISDSMVRYAVDCAIENGVKTWRYASKVIENWITQGINTLDAAKADAAKHREGKTNGESASEQHSEKFGQLGQYL